MSETDDKDRDNEKNRLSQRVGRYSQVSTSIGSIAVKYASRRLLGLKQDDGKNANELTEALGNLKGPIMKVAQMLSTIPDIIPPEYAKHLTALQSQAPSMGWGFVKRRMVSELGADWQDKFASFEKPAAASASLGQVHKAVSLEGETLACKLQYPEMASAVEADLNQLKIALSLYKRIDKGVDTSEVLPEISDRLREELDYEREAAHTNLYSEIFRHEPIIRVPVVKDELSTKRLLTLNWLEGKTLHNYKNSPQEHRNTIARALFRAWWYPFTNYGVLHGDPHLGNYTVFEDETGVPAGLNLLDYGCIRTFQINFIKGVLDLHKGLLTDDRDLIVHAYETWGFNDLSNDLIDVLNIWAGFIYGPLIDDRERTITDGVQTLEYGREEAIAVHVALREKGPVKVPREFIFMDRAAIGLGGVFMFLQAEMNFYRLFHETIENLNLTEIEQRQHEVFGKTGVPLPVASQS